MSSTSFVGIIESPWGITKTQLENANKFFPPVASAPVVSASTPTILQITTAYDQNIELVVTFSTARPISGGVERVAGQQTVNTDVQIDFSRQLPLYWMASVLKEGDISPNQCSYLYSSDTENFDLQLNQNITLTHDKQGWHIPPYNADEYTVNVGFGLRSGAYTSWGYSIPVHPAMVLSGVRAGSYNLFRSNGQEQIGDPVDLNLKHWVMPMGYTYTLQFDSCGNGTLTRQ